MEELVLAHLLSNDEYVRKVMPFIQGEYFADRTHKILFEIIHNYIDEYHKLPTKETIFKTLSELPNITTDEFKSSREFITEATADLETSIDWLTTETEKWCQERSVYNGIMESIKILNGSDAKRSKDAIPTILQEALSVSFDSAIGHDFMADSQSRWEYYHKKEEKIPFDLHYLNKITDGGLSRKTLNMIMASTGVGKTMFMCHCAAANLTDGYNVLYITGEMAEERIAQRIDANLLNISMSDLGDLSLESFQNKVAKVKKNTNGRLIIKEYPTGQASAAHIRHLLQELKLKQKFVPDIIYIDYLNIFASSRMKMGGSVNSYLYIKSIAEEFRGLAVEFNLPIVSATQSNRDAYESSDMGLDNTSESWGLPATADLFLALISTEEFEAMSQIMVKQLKNRYGDMSKNRRFVIGINRDKMRLFDVDDSAQEGFIDGPKKDKPTMDNTKFGERDAEDTAMQFVTKKAGRKDFSALRME